MIYRVAKPFSKCVNSIAIAAIFFCYLRLIGLLAANRMKWIVPFIKKKWDTHANGRLL